MLIILGSGEIGLVSYGKWSWAGRKDDYHMFGSSELFSLILENW